MERTLKEADFYSVHAIRTFPFSALHLCYEIRFTLLEYIGRALWDFGVKKNHLKSGYQPDCSGLTCQEGMFPTALRRSVPCSRQDMASTMPWSGYLKQRLDKMKRIKVGVYLKAFNRCSQKPRRGATPKVDNGHEFFIQLKVWSIYIPGVNPPIAASYPKFSPPNSLLFIFLGVWGSEVSLSFRPRQELFCLNKMEEQQLTGYRVLELKPELRTIKAKSYGIK